MRSNIGEPVLEIEGPLQLVHFYDLLCIIGDPEGAIRVDINPRDFRDCYTWDVNVTGWSFHERALVDPRTTQLGELIFTHTPDQRQGVIAVYGKTKGFILKV